MNTTHPFATASLVTHPIDDTKFLAINCAKGRGIILPGGKLEVGESIEEAAARELKEETGAIAEKQILLLHRVEPHTQAYCCAFLTHIRSYSDLVKETSEGVVTWATWEELRKSQFNKYYKHLQWAYNTYVSP